MQFKVRAVDCPSWVILTGTGGAALLGVDFGILAVDNTLHFRLSDHTFLSKPESETFILLVGATCENMQIFI